MHAQRIPSAEQLPQGLKKLPGKAHIDYALQRIEAYVTERLFETKGNTKGTEFLLQNTLGYANKSDVNSKQEVEVTEKQRIKQPFDTLACTLPFDALDARALTCAQY